MGSSLLPLHLVQRCTMSEVGVSILTLASSQRKGVKERGKLPNWILIGLADKKRQKIEQRPR